MKRLKALIIILVILAVTGCTDAATTINRDDPAVGQTTVKATTTKAPRNPLDFYSVRQRDVKNGLGEVIGTRGYIYISPLDFERTTPEMLADYAKRVIKGSGHKWFTITISNGYGLSFPGSMIEIGSYGKIDYEGIVQKEEVAYILKDDTYETAIGERTPALTSATPSTTEQSSVITPTTEITVTEPSTEPFPMFSFSSTEVRTSRNMTATVTIIGVPGERYSINVMSPSGNSLEADGLDAQVADDSGTVSWSWRVGGSTKTGTGTVTVFDSHRNKASIPYIVE
ncbi:MAG: hypothetical protein QM270_07250 [Bacillota bacterium]|nr:hypothetical protein [Bacillota bacterium]